MCSIDIDRMYNLDVKIDGANARLIVDGEFIIDATFAEPLNGGEAGFANYNAVTWFDNFKLMNAEEAHKHQLSRLGLAMHNYYDAYREFPVSDEYYPEYFDENGAPYLSWRVHLLPFLGLFELYDQFNLDEPWNSPNNISLIDLMPEIFNSYSNDEFKTFVQIISGEGAPFHEGEKTRLSSFEYGYANSILILDAGDMGDEIWTNPAKLEFNPLDPLGLFSGNIPEQITFVSADGRVLSVSGPISPEEFAALVTPDGGELTDALTLNRQEKNQ